MARKTIETGDSIHYRKASWRDALFLYRLRNQPETYRFFRDNKPVKLIGHLLWLSKILTPHSDKTLYVVSYQGKKVGQVRFDKIEKYAAEISLSILKEYMGKGVMSRIFERVGLAYLIEHGDVRKIYAFIHPENERSIHFFRGLRFRKKGKKIGPRYVELKYVKRAKFFLTSK